MSWTDQSKAKPSSRLEQFRAYQRQEYVLKKFQARGFYPQSKSFATVPRLVELMRRLHKNKENIPNEFLTQTEKGLAILIYSKDSENSVASQHDTVFLLLDQNSKPCMINQGDNIHLFNKKYRSEKQYTFNEFETMLIPFRPNWLEIGWQRITQLQFLCAETDDDLLWSMIQTNNAEVRRVLMKRYGIKNLHDPTKVTIIDRDGESVLFDIMIDRNNHRFVEVKDASSDRRYILEVPLSWDDWGGYSHINYPINTCKKAIAWTFEMKPEEYQPVVET